MCVAAAESGASVAASFTDIKSAYYSVIRQLAVGSEAQDDALRAVLARLPLSVEAQRGAVLFIQEQGSLLATGGASQSLVQFMRTLNEDTWFVVDGSNKVSHTLRGARPGETLADLVFIFLFLHIREAVTICFRTYTLYSIEEIFTLLSKLDFLKIIIQVS